MQTTFSFGQDTDLGLIRSRLRGQYPPIRDEQRLEPVCQFVRSFIGSRTRDETSWDVFFRLVRHFRSWDAIADAPEKEIEAKLKEVTFPEKKGPDLKSALQNIRARRGAITLDFLKDFSVEQGLSWLESIHGVGRKISAATLNFSGLRKRAFVAETHIVRILRRFGFVKPKANIEDVYHAVMVAADALDADDLYELHCHLKQLGKDTCTHAEACCDRCPLSQICLKRM